MSPSEFHFIYFKNALDVCLARFVDMHNDAFSRSAEGAYVYSLALGRESFKKEMEQLLDAEFTRLAQPFSIENPKYYFVIGGCDPQNNMLLKYRTEQYFPEKLSKIVYSDKRLKYLLKEKDILFDLDEMNGAFDDLFDGMFKKQDGNIIAVRHSKLDCYSLFKILKWFFRGQKCVNIYKEKFTGRLESLVAVNDLIDRYVNCKTKMNSSVEFRRAMEEIRQYIVERTGLKI